MLHLTCGLFIQVKNLSTSSTAVTLECPLRPVLQEAPHALIKDVGLTYVRTACCTFYLEQGVYSCD